MHWNLTWVPSTSVFRILFLLISNKLLFIIKQIIQGDTVKWIDKKKKKSKMITQTNIVFTLFLLISNELL